MAELSRNEIVSRLTKEHWADQTEFKEALDAYESLSYKDKTYVEIAIETYLNNKYYGIKRERR